MNVLLVDSYDSYTFNLYQLLLDVLPQARVIVIRNDQFSDIELALYLPSFDFIVIGPGPGDPRNPQDVGFIPKLWAFDLPILGVCLGYQALCLEFGGEVGRLSTVKHGQISQLQHNNPDIFGSRQKIYVTRYHSLFGDTANSADLEKLAWVEDGDKNGEVTMAARHAYRPFLGVQYHPESICSQGGEDLVHFFASWATDWNSKHRSERKRLPSSILEWSVKPTPLLSDAAVCPRSRTATHIHDTRRQVHYTVLQTIVDTIAICEHLNADSSSNFILLDAASKPSRYTIIGIVSPKCSSLRYSIGESYVRFDDQEILLGPKRTIWTYIAELLDARRAEGGLADSPFWGGFVGYCSYESGSESIGANRCRAEKKRGRPSDINLLYVERSLVIDHDLGKTYIQTIQINDGEWLASFSKEVLAMHTNTLEPLSHTEVAPNRKPTTSAIVDFPSKESYITNISTAQSFLAEGQSYELCLTALTAVRGYTKTSWQLYKALRRKNPAPFAVYLKLPEVQLVGSSPERFLSWTREGVCEFRPIKGTVKKCSQIGLVEARNILKNPKDMAENLMIVDLIRHDLHQIADSVDVPILMDVEEYETVYQLVSVITGKITQPYSGIDVLSHSLPPGSMTGAPKKRSVELLAGLEKQERGLYSGVCGYFSVCGAGDWSVIIRSAFRSDEGDQKDTWFVGAGGAITALSDPESEWEEMLTKLNSTLPAFTN